MNGRICKILLCLIFLIFLTGCAQKDRSTTLIFGCDYLSMPEESTVAAINQYLEENKCTYTVEFVDLSEVFPDVKTTRAYAKSLEDYIDAENILDLCFLSSYYDGEWITAYDILLGDNYLESITPYFDSEQGIKLRKSMPDSKWLSLENDGEIYGINGYAYNVQSGVTYAVSRTIMEKYNLTEEDLTKKLSDLTEILSEIQAGEEKENPNFECVNFVPNSDTGYYFSKLYPADGFLSGICLDENNAQNPLIYKLDDEEYIDFLREMYDIYADMNIRVSVKSELIYENNFINVYVEGLFPGQNIAQMGYYTRKDEGIAMSKDDVILVYPYDKAFRINDYTSVNAILKASKHKDKAFDFLSRLYCDEELSNLVQYGADYVLNEGHAYTVDEEGKLGATGIISSWIRGNGFIGAPCSYEFDNRRDEYFKYYDKYAYVSPYAGFRFDRRGYEDYIMNTNQVMERLWNIFSKDIDDFDRYIELLRSDFLNAGGDKLYRAVKEQWLEYVNDK